MDKLKWSEDSEFKDHDFSTLDSLTKFIICNDPTQECHMGRCQKCGKVENLKNILMQLLDENSIDEIPYIQEVDAHRQVKPRGDCQVKILLNLLFKCCKST